MCLDNTWSGVCSLRSPLHSSVLSLLLCLASCVCSLPVSYVSCILHILCIHQFRHSPDSECLQRGRGGAGARCWKAVSFLWSSFRKAETQPGESTPYFPFLPLLPLKWLWDSLPSSSDLLALTLLAQPLYSLYHLNLPQGASTSAHPVTHSPEISHQPSPPPGSLPFLQPILSRPVIPFRSLAASNGTHLHLSECCRLGIPLPTVPKHGPASVSVWDAAQCCLEHLLVFSSSFLCGIGFSLDHGLSCLSYLPQSLSFFPVFPSFFMLLLFLPPFLPPFFLSVFIFLKKLMHLLFLMHFCFKENQ